MPDLNFQVIGVDAVAHSLTPLLHFKLRITNSSAQQFIQAVLLTAQIQIQPAQRNYTSTEKENLRELFGPPEAWGQTLRNRLWTHANTNIPRFSGNTEAVLPVACTADLNVAATKYFHALQGGDISLLFLFSGSVFYSEAGRLQVSPVSWNQESVYHLPAATWHALMEQHYPNTAWLTLRRETLDHLCAHKRRLGFLTWEETLEHLLAAADENRQTLVHRVESVPQPP